jgi:hypothetical protein
MIPKIRVMNFTGLPQKEAVLTHLTEVKRVQEFRKSTYDTFIYFMLDGKVQLIEVPAHWDKPSRWTADFTSPSEELSHK